MQRKKIGHIANTFGLRGVFKVALLTDAPEQRFALGSKAEFAGREFEVAGFKLKNAHLALVSFVGLDDINDSEKYIGQDIYAMVEPLPGTVFVDDLMGLAILAPDGTKRDTVTDVVKMNNYDYLALESGKYIPFAIGRFVEAPDYASKTIRLTALGLEALEA